MKKLFFILSILIISVNIFAQDVDYSINSFFLNEDSDDDLKSELENNSWSKNGIQYGFTVNPLFAFLSSDESYLTAAIANTKIWMKAYLMQNSFLYLRLKDSGMYVISSDGKYSGIENANYYDLDLAFLSFASTYGRVQFSMGRKYFDLGTGLVLDDRGDGAEFRYSSSLVDFSIFSFYTGLMITDNNPYSLTEWERLNRARRVFGGTELTLDYYNQNIYLFGLLNYTLSKDSLSYSEEYNSQYYGLGANGIIAGNLSYYGEAIIETGKSYVSSTNKAQSIFAYAFNTGAKYFFQVKTKPVLIAQYAFGSGDPDRTSYTSSTRNSGEDSDNGFIYFGKFNGGRVLNPRLGNLHIFGTGASFTPFNDGKIWLSRMSILAKYSYYLKQISDAPINSEEAAEDSTDVGHAADFSLKWKIFYDLSVYCDYGFFVPGKAYGDNDAIQHMFTTGFNFTF